MALICILLPDRRLFIIAALVPTTLVAGFRYDVGFDFMSYVNYFELLRSTSDVYLDPTFKLITYLIQFLGGNAQALFLLYAILYSVGLYYLVVIAYQKCINRVSITYACGLLLAFYSFNFFLSLNQIRSTLSAVFISCALLKDKKDVSFYIMAFLAILFHSAALFIFPLYFILRRVNVKLLLLMFPFLVFLSYFNLFSGLIKYILLFFDSRFLTYFESEFFIPKTGLEKTYSIFSIIIVLGVVVSCAKLLPRQYDMMIKYVVFFVLLRAMSIDILIFSRLSDFLKPIAIILIFTSVYRLSYLVRPKIVLPCYFACILCLCLFNVMVGSNISKETDYNYYFNICIFSKACVS